MIDVWADENMVITAASRPRLEPGLLHGPHALVRATQCGLPVANAASGQARGDHRSPVQADENQQNRHELDGRLPCIWRRRDILALMPTGDPWPSAYPSRVGEND